MLKDNQQEPIKLGTEEQFLEELKKKIRQGCITLENNSLNATCRYTSEDYYYSVSWDELAKIQEKYRKLEEEDRLCNICLEKEIPEKEKLFCSSCWKKEEKLRKSYAKS